MIEYIKCEICGKQFVGYNGLSNHIKKIHNITSKDYYDKFLKKEGEGICNFCGKEPKFKNLVKGYQKYCNLKCSNNCEDRKEKFKKSYLSNDISKIREKREQTNLKLYGNIIANRSDEIKERTKQIFISKFGCNPMKLDKFKKKSTKNRLKQTKREVIDLVLENEKLELIGEYKGAHVESSFKCLVCKKEFITIWNYIQQGKRCPYCYKPNNRSIPEDEIFSFLCSVGVKNIIQNSRKIIYPQELDLFIPGNNAIEYDGLHWHSEEQLEDPVYYHVKKTNKCDKKKIKLIHIFEDEWLFKKDLVKEILKHKLGKNKNKRIHARQCIIKEIDPKTKNNFLEKYHIQGKDSSTIKLGAFYKDELVSVMTFAYGNPSKGSRKEEGVWELNRFCSNFNYHIPGVAGKLLSHFKRSFLWKQIFSYADRRWSTGNLYYQLGFNLVHITKPNYWYIANYQRIHRYNLRKRADEPKDIPEHILRKQEGYNRIWDCGSYKFVVLNHKNF
jgi:hypothetical protein